MYMLKNIKKYETFLFVYSMILTIRIRMPLSQDPDPVQTSLPGSATTVEGPPRCFTISEFLILANFKYNILQRIF